MVVLNPKCVLILVLSFLGGSPCKLQVMGILRRDVVALQITYIWSVFTEYVLYVRESDEGPLLMASRPMTGTSLRLTDFMVSTSYPRVQAQTISSLGLLLLGLLWT